VHVRLRTKAFFMFCFILIFMYAHLLIKCIINLKKTKISCLICSDNSVFREA